MRRILCAGLFLIWASSGAGSTLPLPTLTLDDRVRALEAVERIYFSHLEGETRTFEQAMPPQILQRRVRDYLKQSLALEHLWGRAITGAALQDEVERMVRDTRDPAMLAELFAALDDDPLLIQECLARPMLVDRLSRAAHASDAALHAGARLEADVLHDALASGQIELTEEDPRRSVVEVSIDPAGTQSLSMVQGIGDVAEQSEGFSMSAVLERDGEHERVAHWMVPKVTWDAWWETIAPSLDETQAVIVASESVTLPSPGGSSGLATCGADDVWTPLSTTGAPSPRSSHAAVWTGSHMIVWGGGGNGVVSTGGRYDPATDSWSPTSTANAPSARWSPHAVWTGRHIIVWGGYVTFPHGLASGGRYDPVADTWSSISTVDAPEARIYSSAVWTGRHMIVWGGRVEDRVTLNTGGRYDPALDQWTPTSTASAPEIRQGQTAVWTGNRMVIWGGACYTIADSCLTCSDPTDPATCFGGTFYNSGGRYDPVSDLWEPTAQLNAPTPRVSHAAVWTGSLMVIWGGSGATFHEKAERYNEATDAWLSSPLLGTEPEPRIFARSIWTGNRMVAWGGWRSFIQLNTGGRYDPVAQAWSSTTMNGVPPPRRDYTLTWDGHEMLVWGGSDNTGVRPDTGYAYAVNVSGSVDGDGDGFRASCECDDGDASVHPGATEACDGVDQDCDAQVDEDLGSTTCGAGACVRTVDNCAGGTSQTCTPGPPSPETCNEIDDDCDGVVPADELDGDSDGYAGCQGDCNDSSPGVRPGAAELPGNAADENCDGLLACDPGAFYKTHAQFVGCVKRECDQLVAGGLATSAQCHALVTQAAQSNVGRRQRFRTPPVPQEP